MQTATIHISRYFFPSFWSRFLWFFRRKRHALKLPESWEEVPANLIPDICKIIMTRSDEQDGNVRILQLLSGLPAVIFHNINPLDIVEKLAPRIQWIYKELLITPHLSEITYKKHSYLMPAGDFSDFTFAAFKQADQAYTDLTSKVSDSAINTLCMIVLHTDHDLSGLPDKYKFYILYWFMSCKESLYEQYFSGLKDDSKDSNEEPADWEDITTDIAENGAFGNYTQVNRTPVHIIYKWLYKNRKRYLKDKQKSLEEQIKANHQNIANR